MDLKNILTAWKIAMNPSKEQKELSEKRIGICELCEHKKGGFCSKCGCPIRKKSFTPAYNPCPRKKWGDVDDIFFDKQKVNKTII